MEVLKISAKTHSSSAAGALTEVIKQNGEAELQAIGAAAVNQAVKAVIIAKGFLAPAGIDLSCTPAFIDIVIDGQERTGIKLIVKKL